MIRLFLATSDFTTQDINDCVFKVVRTTSGQVDYEDYHHHFLNRFNEKDLRALKVIQVDPEAITCAKEHEYVHPPKRVIVVNPEATAKVSKKPSVLKVPNDVAISFGQIFPSTTTTMF